VLFALICGHVSAQNCAPVRYLEEVFEEVTVNTGISFGQADPYGIIGSQDLQLDLYMPSGDVLEKRPLIIYAFGGGFLIGFRSQPPIPEYCERWARMGYVVAAIDYRIGFNTTSSGSAERAVYRGVQDVRAAMRFLGQFSAGYGIDTTSIFLTGSSAGCFSALHSTFMEESDRPQSTYGILLEPSDMGCPDCSGNNYLNNRELRPRGIINHWGAILDTLYMDPTEKDNVPVISFHGTADLIVPYASGSPFSYPIFPTVHGSAPIHQRLSNLGVLNELHAWEGVGHEPWLTEPQWLDTVFTYSPPFLYETMRPQTSAISGDEQVPLGEVRTYSVTGWAGSSFCWEVTGGTVIADNGSSIDVLWDVAGTWTVSVTEVSSIDVVGNAQTLEVEVSELISVLPAGTAPFGIFPNPTDGAVRVHGMADGRCAFTVNDLAGRKVLTGDVAVAGGVASIDLSALPNGTYLLHISDGMTAHVATVIRAE
jgi:acetyl esterase/lipase